jgi:hypothetical protein
LFRLRLAGSLFLISWTCYRPYNVKPDCHVSRFLARSILSKHSCFHFFTHPHIGSSLSRRVSNIIYSPRVKRSLPRSELHIFLLNFELRSVPFSLASGKVGTCVAGGIFWGTVWVLLSMFLVRIIPNTSNIKASFFFFHCVHIPTVSHGNCSHLRLSLYGHNPS